MKKLYKEEELPGKESIPWRFQNLEDENDNLVDYSKLLIEARFLISSKNMAQAENLLEKIFAKIPYNADCLFLLGETKRIIGKLREAELLFEKSMQQENFSPLVYKSLAQVLILQQKQGDASFFLRKYLLYKKDEEEAITLLGKCLLALGEFAEASICFNKSIELNPDKLENYILRSKASSALGLVNISQRDIDHFTKNKTEYLEHLAEQASRLRSSGKVLESDQILELMEKLTYL